MTTNNLHNIIWIFFTFTLFGCSHTPNEKNNSPIQKYNEYVDVLAKASYEGLLNEYWAQRVVAEGLPLLMNVSESNKLDRNSIILSINFPKDMKSIVFQKMKIENSSACVLVAGVSEEDTPMIFNITYTKEKHNWLIEEVHATFLRKSDSYPSQPDCSPIEP